MTDEELKELKQDMKKQSDLLMEVRLSQVRHEGRIKELEEWRLAFEKSIKESISLLNEKVDDVKEDIGKKFETFGDKIFLYVREATAKLPLWASVTGGLLIAILGWAVSFILYFHR